jgi:hypothetical protein
MSNNRECSLQVERIQVDCNIFEFGRIENPDSRSLMQIKISISFKGLPIDFYYMFG